MSLHVGSQQKCWNSLVSLPWQPSSSFASQCAGLVSHQPARSVPKLVIDYNPAIRAHLFSSPGTVPRHCGGGNRFRYTFTRYLTEASSASIRRFISAGTGVFLFSV